MKTTFIPGIWTQSTAVPVAFERNSAKVSSANERSLPKENKEKRNMILLVQQQTYIQPNTMKNMMENRSWWMIYPAGLLASLSECCGVVTAESQLASAAAGACTKYQIMWPMSKHEEKKENYTSAESRDLN